MRNALLCSLVSRLGSKVIAVDRGLVLTAVKIQERHGISYWDAQIIAAAQLACCALIYSEDLQDGGVYEGVRVTNPFV
ncbi:MAG: PIN domain-containing protein [Spirochaetota bacterium]